MAGGPDNAGCCSFPVGGYCASYAGEAAIWLARPSQSYSYFTGEKTYANFWGAILFQAMELLLSLSI